MKKLVLVELLAASLLVSPLLFAQSDLDGTWKIDLKKTAMPTKPDVFLLQNGTYQCKTCVPVISIEADGQDQNITGTPYYDSISVKVLDDRSIEKTEKKNGKTVATSRMTLSPDGKTATIEFTDSTYTNSDPIAGKETLTRVAKSKRSPAGSHAISGVWQTSRIQELSNNAVIFTFKLEDDSLSMTNPTGQSYTAKFDGTDAPYKGDPGISSVSLVRLGKYTFVETDKRDGKQQVRSKRFMVNPGDPSTLNLIADDTLKGTTVFVALKQ